MFFPVKREYTINIGYIYIYLACKTELYIRIHKMLCCLFMTIQIELFIGTEWIIFTLKDFLSEWEEENNVSMNDLGIRSLF